jgi:hypothetical protein
MPKILHSSTKAHTHMRAHTHITYIDTEVHYVKQLQYVSFHQNVTKEQKHIFNFVNTLK